jgi:hypothetical protein
VLVTHNRSLGTVLLARVSGGDGVIAAEADERMFEAVQEVMARYKDALVADLNGGGAAPRVRSEVSDYELEIAGVRLAMKYEHGGRSLPKGAPSGALAKSRQLGCSSLCDGEGGFGLDNSPPAMRTAADGALGRASIRKTGAMSCPAPRSRHHAPPCATAGPPALKSIQFIYALRFSGILIKSRSFWHFFNYK